MDDHIAANVLGIIGAVLWSLQIWKNWQRHDSQGLSSSFFLLWAIAGVPLGAYNISNNLNIALKIQPNILIFLSLLTWSQCRYYGEGGPIFKVLIWSVAIAFLLSGLETGLVFALRIANDHGQQWTSILVAVAAAVLLATGVLRHVRDIMKTRSDAGLSLRFAVLDASGDLASLLSVLFEKTLNVAGLAIYATELAIWLLSIAIIAFYRITAICNWGEEELPL